jgi:putative copper resistance protein D
VLALAEISGTSVVSALSPAALGGFVSDVAQGRAMLVVVVVAVILSLVGTWVRTTTGARLLLVGAVVALVPPTLTGHAADPASHELAVLTIVAHVLSVSCWIGGLAAVVLFARGATLASAASRFSSLALGCFVVAGLSGAANAWIRVGGAPGVGHLWGSQYGWLLTGKIVAFLALGWFGWWHRRRTLPGVAAGRPAAFRRFAGVEAIVMVLAVVLAVALARSPTPAPAGRSELGLPCSSDPAVLIETVPHAVVARWEYLCSL